ncbi:lipocalin-like domain-containing protein [Hymenobacter properus]|uniref:Lipocalin family protein n=1 Tax=Hymenobacter properus TaxID=2791026 RepID=A0A931BH85_9BACT|nr:lipocalin family protein [Hymenobacter properus]MBF9140163.1 lipocalin family protein [Hymenobacter properus]MBR7718970.1 lipocalin family protein [Microvirga sp. SRT04]
MFTFRLRNWLALSVFAASALGSCSKKDDSKPVAASATTQQLATNGSWRLDEITQNSQVSSSGAGIKDRYSLKFRSDGTYTQNLLADNTTYNGTWMLMSNNTVLHFVDHKGANSEYTISSVSGNSLRYRFTNKSNQTEELGFSAQP